MALSFENSSLPAFPCFDSAETSTNIDTGEVPKRPDERPSGHQKAETRKPAACNRQNSYNEEVKKFAKITRKRFQLMKTARVLNDIMVALVISGLLLAIAVQQLIIENTFGEGVHSWNHPVLIALRCVLSVSTIVLACLNIALQVFTVRLRSLNTSERSVFVLVRAKHCALTVVELVLCAVHPLPLDFRAYQSEVSPSAPFFGASTVNVNMFLTVFMFVRVYLVARCVLLHHPLYRTRLAHLLGPMNRVRIGYGFVFRCAMDAHAGLIMLMLVAFVWLGAAWALLACDTVPGSRTHYYPDAVWLVVITFFTVCVHYSNSLETV